MAPVADVKCQPAVRRSSSRRCWLATVRTTPQPRHASHCRQYGIGCREGWRCGPLRDTHPPIAGEVALLPSDQIAWSAQLRVVLAGPPGVRGGERIRAEAQVASEPQLVQVAAKDFVVTRNGRPDAAAAARFPEGRHTSCPISAHGPTYQ